MYILRVVLYSSMSNVMNMLRVVLYSSMPHDMYMLRVVLYCSVYVICLERVVFVYIHIQAGVIL